MATGKGRRNMAYKTLRFDRPSLVIRFHPGNNFCRHAAGIGTHLVAVPIGIGRCWQAAPRVDLALLTIS
jgi:hypothetical protein